MIINRHNFRQISAANFIVSALAGLLIIFDLPVLKSYEPFIYKLDVLAVNVTNDFPKKLISS